MHANTPSYQLLVIGGSAGSLSVVLKIIPLLKKEMNMAVIIVFHRKSSEDNTLIDVLSSRTDFTVKETEDKDEIQPGVIYVAPADYHVLIEKNKTISLDASEKINYSRPSIDVTFESAAEAYTDSLICMLLSGANADGVQGLLIAKRLGAYIIIQDPQTAEVSYMPEQALQKTQPHLLLNSDDSDQLLSVLTP
ncbi:MAG: chemotaxis protein CheB [Azospira oryzae]|nr:MAG: chemotaxis protein CheB [Azospira oryzae]